MEARAEVTCWTVALALLGCVSAANADMVLSSWQYEASMAAAGHAFGSATVGGNIYTFGGNAPGADYGTNRVQRYNPAADMSAIP